MKSKTLQLLLWTATGLLAAVTLSAQVSLRIDRMGGSDVHLAWTNSPTLFLLEQTSAANFPNGWTTVLQEPTLMADEFGIILTATNGGRFFRLRERPLTHISSTSPLNGESGVGPTRETIIYFSAPLASNTFLTTTHLHADFGGRRLLSRVELAENRDRVTLFYEPLPASARVRVTFSPFGLLDRWNRFVDVDGDGQPGGSAVIDFDTLATTPLADTAIAGTVFASEPVPGTNTTNFINRPLEGVTITVDGAEESLRTVTDMNGQFLLQPAPAGDFFVHIDGRTLTNLAAGIRYPDMDYYPFVGKMWHADAGKTNLAAGTGLIYLPLIRTGTLHTVSATQETMITFPPSVIASNPALAGVHLMVPPNSLFSDNGTRGGMIGIAPVAPDRLPGPLPPGLEFPLVITVQTDGGENFDRPVPAKFPNLPDPVTGQRLPPGAKSALWSFNHDTGLWEMQGAMTVTADGQFLESDSGVGIRSPGWHGAFPGCGGSGGDGIGCPAGQNCSGGSCGTHGTNGSAVAALIGPAKSPQSGDCDPDTPECQCQTPVEVNFFAGPIIYQTQWDGGPKGGEFWPTMPVVETALCQNGKCYTLSVTSADNATWINLFFDSFRTPQPFDGGNITRENYCEVLGMLWLNGGAMCKNGWFTLEALLAHEMTHFEEHRLFIEGTWLAVRSAIESMCLPCDGVDADLARALLEARRDDVLAAWAAKVAEYQAIKEQNHKTCFCDEPFLRSQELLNPLAQQVEAYGRSKGWGTALDCPPRISHCRYPPLPAPLPLRAPQDPPVFVRLHASIVPATINPGDSAQFRAWAEYSDNSFVDVTLSAALLSLNTNQALITTQGVVHAVNPGRVRLRAEFFPEFGVHVSTTAELSIRDPLDQDLDLMPDALEVIHGLNPADPSDADTDKDGDGLTNAEEMRQGTAPSRADTDGDDVPDGEELIAGRNPLQPSDLAPEPETGLFHYVIMNLDRLEIVHRGMAAKDDAAYRQLILAPNSHYRQWLVSKRTGHIGTAEVTTRDAGTPFQFPGIHLRPSRELDVDGDGLPSDVEFVVGTNPFNPDSDGDGVKDGAEVFQGSDPLDNRPVRTGIIANIKTPGPALDVCAVNQLVVVAEGNAGVAVFKAEPGKNAVITAQVDTPGNAQRIACGGELVAVADGEAGLAIIDITDPPAARIVHQIRLGSAVNAVALNGTIAYAGLEGGQVVTVDVLNGVVLDRKNIPGPLRDVGLGREFLYAVAESGGGDKFVALPLIGGLPSAASSIVTAPYYISGNRRLFVGGDVAYTTHSKGYNTFSLTNPALPALIATTNTTQFGWKQIVPNGSGLAVAAVGANSTLEDPAQHNVSLYDVSNPSQLDVFLTQFPTPGFARAVSIYDGLAYVADDTAGLQIINYRPYDALGVPPLVTLEHSAPSIGIEEGKPLRLTALVSDDVQVRNVEFYVDGRRVVIDGNYPFEHRLPAPRPAEGQTEILVRALATDTGGNTNWSTVISIHVAPDLTPPALVSTTPVEDGYRLNTQPALFIARFNEILNSVTINNLSVRLVHAGMDGILGTPDDAAVTGTVAWREEFHGITFTAATPFTPGRYQVGLSSNIADLAGNQLAASVTRHFQVLTNYLIAYSVAGSPEGTNWFMTSEGAADQPLNTGERPRLSPHGHYAAFRRGTQPDVELRPIWLRDLRTGAERQVRSSGGQIHNIDWMPDGERVVFESSGIFTMDIFGGNITQIGYAQFASEGWPTINPVDQSIVVHFQTPSVSFFRYIEPNGTNSYLIPNVGGSSGGVLPTHDMCPSWAPDGQNIAFLRGKYEEPNPAFSGPNIYRGDIFLVRRDGTALRQLTTFGPESTNYFFPALAWTPDGSSIVTAGYVSNEYGIYHVDAGSGAITRLKASAAPVTYVGSAVIAPLDAQAPVVVSTTPSSGQALMANEVSNVAVVFSERLETSTITSTTIQIIGAGADDLFGTGDDAQQPGTLAYNDGTLTIVFTPTTPLSSGLYRIAVSPRLTDLAGNPLNDTSNRTFRILAPFLIAYSVAGSPEGTNWLMTSDGSYDQLITLGEWPRLSPNGRYLAFRRGTQAEIFRRDIWVRDLVSRTERSVFVVGNFPVANFVWTADSAHLIFDYDFNGITRIDHDGANRTRLGRICDGWWPSVNPVDQSYVFARPPNPTAVLQWADAGLTQCLNIPNTSSGFSEGHSSSPSWSPNGERIAFLYGRAASPIPSGLHTIYEGNIYTIRSDGSARRQLTFFNFPPLNYISPDYFSPALVWSPHGDAIITAGHIDGEYGIYRIDVTTGVMAKIKSSTMPINYVGSCQIGAPPEP